MKCTRKHTKDSVENVKTTRGSKPFALCNPLAPVRSKHDLLQIFAATPYIYRERERERGNTDPRGHIQ